jgi:DNA-cytosine methyltransferase
MAAAFRIAVRGFLGMPTYGSLFSGIGGFDLGFERAGWRCAWQVEVDPDCIKVLGRHWPDVKRYGDIAALQPGHVEAVDLICGGFPCQDVSVAGRRAGLAGKRSGLFYEFMRLVDGLRPGWVVIENVPGLLSSSGGRDMGAIVGTLGDIGYWWSYRVLDAQYFGLAQRRKRVFIVAGLGGRSGPAEVLFEPESLPGDTPPRGPARPDVANAVTRSLGGGGPDDNKAQAGHIITPPNMVGNGDAHSGFRDEHSLVMRCKAFGDYTPDDTSATLAVGDNSGKADLVLRDVAQSLTSNYGKQPDNSDTGLGPTLVVGPLAPNAGPRSHDAGNFHCNQAVDAGHLVIGEHETTHALTAEGADASEDGTGRGTPLVVAAPLTAGYGKGNELDPRCPDRLVTVYGGEVSAPLVASLGICPTGHQKDGAVVVQDSAEICDQPGPVPLLEVGARSGDDPRDGLDVGQPGDPMFSLEASKQHGIVAFNWQSSEKEPIMASEELANPLRVGQGQAVLFGSEEIPGRKASQAVAIAETSDADVSPEEEVTVTTFAEYSGGGCGEVGDKSPALTSGGGKVGQGYQAVAINLRGREGGGTAEMGGDKATALRASQGGGPHALHAPHSGLVRRLTPVECERLQGFPDGWTGCVSDSARYRMLGNAVAVPVAEWVGRRILRRN